MSCLICLDARWICITDDGLRPFHDDAMPVTGEPCPFCNPGPEYLPWSRNCLGCTTPELFAAANPDDPDAEVLLLEAMYER